MNYKRALAYGIFLFIGAIGMGALSLLLGLATADEYSMNAFILTWILYVPITYLVAKWFFKMGEPTIAKGFQLGVIAVLVNVGVHIFFLGIAPLTGGDPNSVVRSLQQWQYYLTLLELLLLSTYFGYEFDATYTKPDLQ